MNEITKQKLIEQCKQLIDDGIDEKYCIPDLVAMHPYSQLMHVLETPKEESNIVLPDNATPPVSPYIYALILTKSTGRQYFRIAYIRNYGNMPYPDNNKVLVAPRESVVLVWKFNL